MSWYDKEINRQIVIDACKDVKELFLRDIEARKEAGWDMEEQIKFWRGMAETGETHAQYYPLRKLWIERYYDEL
jgi:hypothetical protein